MGTRRVPVQVQLQHALVLRSICSNQPCDLPQDFLFQYRAGIEAVTTEDVLAAAQRHLHPDQQIIVMAADKTIAEPALRQKGWQVQLLDVDLPA